MLYCYYYCYYYVYPCLLATKPHLHPGKTSPGSCHDDQTNHRQVLQDHVVIQVLHRKWSTD